MSDSTFAVDGSELTRVSMNGVAIIDDGEIARANDELAEIHGTDGAATMVGREWEGCYVFQGVGRTTGDVQEAVRQDGEYRGTALAIAEDGTEVPVELSVCASNDCLVCVVAERSSATPDRAAPAIGDRSGITISDTMERATFVENVLGALDDVVYVIDGNDDLVGWNSRLNERLGYTDEELFEMELPEFLAPADRELLAEAPGGMVDLLDRVREMEVVSKDGERIPHELRGVTFQDETTGERYRVGVARDISGRKEREERLERYETIVETVDDGIYVLDGDLTVDMANERFFEMMSQFGISREEVRNMHAHDLVPRDDDRESLEEAIQEAIENEPHTGSFEMSGETPRGESVVCESRFRLYPDPQGEHRGCIGILRDITERKERERELRSARRFNAELVENAPFSIVRIDEEFRITYLNPRTEEVTGLPKGKESEALGVDIRELPSVAETGEAYRFTPLKDGETVEFEFPFESLYGREVYLTGRGVPLMSAGEFTGAVLMSVDISERRQHEKDLERQRDELDTLNRINELLLAVCRDLFELPKQVDIEETVCTRLANSNLYQFAWIGKPEAGGNRLNIDVYAGVSDEFIESMVITTDDRATGQSPVSRAFRTGDIQINQSIESDPTFEPLREAVPDHDVRSMAAVPITYDGSTYGVLAVYASRPFAFSQREQRGFEMLGEAIGYAINANRTRQLLFAEKVVELKLGLSDTSEFLIGMSNRIGCHVSLEGYVSTNSRSWLMYFSLSDPDSDQVVETARSEPTVESVRTIRSGEALVLAITAKSPLLDTIAALGGTISSGTITDGRGEFVVQVPKSANSSEFHEQLQSVYSGIEILAKRDNERPITPSDWVSGDGLVELTDRQRQALEAAYRSGYFEWPRENAADDVADLLNISRPTFQAHVRKAENEVFSKFFSGSEKAE